MIQKIQHMKFLSIAMLGLWGLVFWNNFNNKHVHLTENGHLIVHAHPFQKGEKDHNHTEEEYIFWDIISNAHFHAFASEILIPENLPLFFVDFQGLSQEFLLKSCDKSPSSLRGPPAIFS